MLSRLDLDAIIPNPDQPRKSFDDKSLNELADSIAKNGLLQPITVRPMGKDRYEIVAGERRYRAHCILRSRGIEQFKTILCHIKRMDDHKRDIAAIIENLQRADVTPLEEANAFARLVATGMTAEDIADQVGAPLFRVRWRLQLLNLADDIRHLFASGNLGRQEAMEIARLPEHVDQHRILTLVRRGKLVGWKAVRNAVDALLDKGAQGGMFGPLPEASDDDLSTISGMERRIDSVAAMLGRGWKDGECTVASKVAPDRAGRMADKISAMMSALRIMERELRNSAAQTAALFDAA